ncbi:hypothetical protein BJF85_02670 [Saccharomonospora sp. CUA-673]|uniref:IclR family transcriptional regulator n=1 Tax=Saccharomonospora sp. CUA-673 TaxID=1904969 RepID=UPI0009654932|nr:IclR family transcriptional regulator [Saccharomonospora sp. CUA-673]OLT45278.1 hypothetical protein BJF85_02670 [Saccharomonospora sp. CUA-673]
MTTEPETGTRAALTALRVLETVSTLQPAGVTAVARAADIPKSSAQRYLHTLKEAGWIAPLHGDKARWALTGKALTVGLRASDDVGLREVARDTMERLRDDTAETIHLSSFTDTATNPDEALVIVDRLDSMQPVRTWVRLGTAAPLHASCSGRAVLAALDDDEARAWLAEPLQQYSDHTLATVDDVLADLATIRRTGYSTVASGWRHGVGAVGAAIVDRHGRPVGALAVSMPEQRYSPDRAAEFGPLVAHAAREVSDALA